MLAKKEAALQAIIDNQKNIIEQICKKYRAERDKQDNKEQEVETSESKTEGVSAEKKEKEHI